jgi:hypothetical protein
VDREGHKAKGKTQEVKDEGEVIRLLDANRARNISTSSVPSVPSYVLRVAWLTTTTSSWSAVIVANRMHIPPSQVKQAIWNIDMEVLTLDRVQILLKTIPSDAEMELLSSHALDPSRLGPSEQFCLELMVRVLRACSWPACWLAG